MNLADRLPDPELLRLIGQAADALGTPAYVVGGYVRDLLLGRPVGDADVVCIGDGMALAQEFAALLHKPAEVITFKNFGTAQVKAEGVEVEFVGARRESYRGESRKPEVEPGTLEDDQRRRDFTVNALSISLNKGTFGELLDPFDGQGDMERKLLKTPLEPEQTFSDDPLRMMRAIRFAAQLGYDIEPDTFAAIQQQKERLLIVSMERIMVEFNKILMSERPGYGLRLAYYSGLLEVFFPELVALKGVENVEGKSHKDNFFHTIEVLENVIALGNADLWLRWAALLHDIAKPATKRFDKKVGWTFHGHEDKGARWVPGIFRKFKLPLGPEMKRVQNLVRLHLRPISLVNEQVTDSAVRRLVADAGEDLNELMQLVRADVTTKNPNKARRYLGNFDMVEEKFRQVDEADRLRNFQPVLTGEMIMRALNLKPSPEIGIYKTQIREDLLDGRLVNTLEACYARLTELAAERGAVIEASLEEIKALEVKEVSS